MRNRTRMTSLLSAGVLAAGLSVATAAAAGAAVTPNTLPHGCGFTEPNGWTATTTCRYGPGHQRADITCEDGITGNTTKEYGPWVQWYQNSTATCPDPSRFYIIWVVSDVSS